MAATKYASPSWSGYEQNEYFKQGQLTSKLYILILPKSSQNEKFCAFHFIFHTPDFCKNSFWNPLDKYVGHFCLFSSFSWDKHLFSVEQCPIPTAVVTSEQLLKSKSCIQHVGFINKLWFFVFYSLSYILHMFWQTYLLLV